MSKNPESPRSLFERRHGAVPIASLAPAGEEDVVPVRALAPEGEEDVVPVSALAMPGEGDVVAISALAMPDEGDVVAISALAMPGEGDVVPVRALAPDAELREVAEAALPGWEQWESALAAIGRTPPNGAKQTEAPEHSSPAPFPTDDFGFLDLPEDYRLAAARGVADPAEWPTDEEWRRAAATPAFGGAAVMDDHDAASRDIELRLRAARLLSGIADRVRDGSLPLNANGEPVGEAGLLAMVLESVIDRAGEAGAGTRLRGGQPGAGEG